MASAVANAAIEDDGEDRADPGVSPVWTIVSKVVAALVGGGILTWWVGAASAKLIAVSGFIARGDATPMSGLAQMICIVCIVMWVAATNSIKKTWIVLAILIGLCVGIATFVTVPPPPARGAGFGAGAGADDGAGGAPGAGRRGGGRFGRGGAGGFGPGGAGAPGGAAGAGRFGPQGAQGLGAQGAGGPVADASGAPGAGRGPGGPNAGQGRGAGGGRQLAMLASLDLDAGQQAKATQIFADARQKAQAQAGPDADPAARGAAFRQANLAAFGQIEAILRPDQKAKFAALRQQMQSGGFGRGGAGGPGGRRGPPAGDGGGAPAESSAQ